VTNRMEIPMTKNPMMTAPARRARRSVKRLLTRTREDQRAHVHFHRGPQGLPAACHDPRCTSPHLDV
jgi:hypothetical protein